ncbi:hypothetical protein [Microbacterium pumilum]|uniref:Uncharacterized protein n=1 Tax=Microbacterium pumilum TaxID=344165 RepID=A0ABN2SAN0_9MICO
METWHPILAAVEGPTGTWRMLDSLGEQYGTIEIRRVMNDTDTRYRATFRGEVIGWATTLQYACEQVHRAFLRAHGPSGGPIAGWGERPPVQAPKKPTPRSG